MIATVGGAMSGYCATGSTCDAISPAMVMMIAMTAAKIGRRMKKCDSMRFGPYLGAAGCRA